MAITIRDIIANALAESRLVKRNQPAPTDLFVSAYQLLQDRLSEYSNTNLLSFIRKEVDVTFDSEARSLIIGEFIPKDDYVIKFDTHEPVDSGIAGEMVFDKIERKLYQWQGGWVELEQPQDYFIVYPDIEVDNLQTVVRCYRMSDNQIIEEMNFLAYEDFYRHTLTLNVYSVLPIAEDAVQLMVKPGVKKVKIIYNEKFDFDENSTLHIPNQFVALFTAGLVYDLARQYPRLSDNTVQLLKQRLDKLEENVRTSSSVSKFIGRDINYRTMSYGDFCQGRFLYY